MNPAYSGLDESSLPAGRVDLDRSDHIDRMVDRFYERLLADRQVAPWFTEVAKVDMDAHLPLISLYWQKMLLGDRRYRRHTMARHRDLHDKRRLTAVQLEHWLAHFEATLDEEFAGPMTERARLIARRVMANLARQLSLPAPPACGSGEVGDGEVGQEQAGAPDIAAGDQ